MWIVRSLNRLKPVNVLWKYHRCQKLTSSRESRDVSTVLVIYRSDVKEKADDVLLWKLLPKEDGCILQKKRKNEQQNQTVSKGVMCCCWCFSCGFSETTSISRSRPREIPYWSSLILNGWYFPNLRISRSCLCENYRELWFSPIICCGSQGKLERRKMNAINAGSFPRGCLGNHHGVGGFKGGNIALWGGLGNFTVTRHKQNPPTPPSFPQTIINDRS